MLDPTTSDSPPPHRHRSDILTWAAFIAAVANLINAVHGWW